MKNERVRRGILILYQLLLAAVVLLSWGSMVFDAQTGQLLADKGLASLKYYTVLSNLLAALAALLCAASLLRGEPPRWVRILKLSAAAAVGITFTVVVAFLGLIYGYRSMYQGANLWLHLIVPLMAMGELCLVRYAPLERRDTLWAMLFTVLYGLGYLGNILLNGRGEWPHTNDWYAFMTWGLGAGLCIYAALVLLTWGIAIALRGVNRRFGEIGRK